MKAVQNNDCHHQLLSVPVELAAILVVFAVVEVEFADGLV
jgi:hypothetical protein